MNLDEPSDDEFAALEHQFFTQLDATARRRTRKHRTIALGAGLTLLAGATTAGVILANQHTRDNASYCYSAADTQSRFTTAIQVDGQNPNDAAAAVEQCAAIWKIGFFDSTNPPPTDGTEHAAPPLQACLRNDGVLAVFPREDGRPADGFCSTIGHQPAP